MDRKAPDVALFLGGLSFGGIQTVMLRLAREFRGRGLEVDIVTIRDDGDLAPNIPQGARHVCLPAGGFGRWRALGREIKKLGRHLLPLLGAAPSKRWNYLAGLADYLARRQPRALISADTYNNLLAIHARSRAAAATRLMVTEHSTLSAKLAAHRNARLWRWRHLPSLVGHAYPRADLIGAVSDGVAADLAATAGLPRERIVTLYNPIVDDSLDALAAVPIDDPWFASDGRPLVLAVARLVPAKGLDVLLRAVARVRRTRDIRLAILGDGEARPALQRLAAGLGLGADVLHMPGFDANPYRYMASASLLALSSRHEGFANVVAEALACGCPVVSMDCPSGPAEILEVGRWGRLVPVDDVEALAAAIAEDLDQDHDRAALRRRGRMFSAAAAADAYLAALGLGPAPVFTGAAQPLPEGNDQTFRGT